MRRARIFFGASVLTLIVVVLVVVAVAVPLFTVYRSTCEGRERSWSFVAPWDDPPADCRNHMNGFEILKDEVGID
jgi:hypothetical protein